MEKAILVAAIGGALAIMGYVMTRKENDTLSGGEGSDNLTGEQGNDTLFQGRFTPKELLTMTRVTASRHGSLAADPVMAATIALVESSGDPKAYRFEGHLNDASLGLMQTLYATARDMYRRGYSAVPLSRPEDLYNPGTSIYYGMAYLTWLRNFGTEEERLVRNYNGGPRGYLKEATLQYWQKYKAKKQLILEEVTA